MNPHPVHHGSAVLHHFTAGHKQQLEIRGERQGEGRGRREELSHHKDTENTEFRNRIKILDTDFPIFLSLRVLCVSVVKKSPPRPPSPSASSPD